MVERQIVLLDLDEELLVEAQRQISASSASEAINAALSLLVERARARRLAALDRLRQMSAGFGLKRTLGSRCAR